MGQVDMEFIKMSNRAKPSVSTMENSLRHHIAAMLSHAGVEDVGELIAKTIDVVDFLNSQKISSHALKGIFYQLPTDFQDKVHENLDNQQCELDFEQTATWASEQKIERMKRIVTILISDFGYTSVDKIIGTACLIYDYLSELTHHFLFTGEEKELIESRLRLIRSFVKPGDKLYGLDLISKIQRIEKYLG